MEFLGVGYQEVLLILVLLLVVVGPERLPAMAYQLGRAVRTMQQYARVVRDEFKDEIDYLDTQYRAVKGQVDSANQELRAQQRSWNADMKSLGAPGDAPPSNVVPFESQTVIDGAVAASPALQSAAVTAAEPSPPAESGSTNGATEQPAAPEPEPEAAAPKQPLVF